SGERAADTAVEAMQSTGATVSGRKRVNRTGEKTERQRNRGNAVGDEFIKLNPKFLAEKL
ncbi:hypothetical protein L195_g050095, partial [Trifolium pratense]